MKKKNNQKYKYHKFESVSEILLRSLSDGCEPFLVETAFDSTNRQKGNGKTKKAVWQIEAKIRKFAVMFLFSF